MMLSMTLKATTGMKLEAKMGITLGDMTLKDSPAVKVLVGRVGRSRMETDL
ncbi:MAG TPA: hypothetical protein VIJ78_07755 [Pseudolabrys sp.]